MFLSKLLSGEVNFLRGYTTEQFRDLVIIKSEKHSKNWNIDNNNNKKSDKLSILSMGVFGVDRLKDKTLKDEVDMKQDKYWNCYNTGVMKKKDDIELLPEKK